MVIFKKIKSEWGVLKQTIDEFSNDNGMKLSASLSYYTVFSVAPMLFIVISFAGIFYGREAVQGRLFWEIRKLIGDNAAAQIQEMIAHTQLQNNTTLGAIMGGVALVIGATGVFTEIQDSINYIWSIKAKPAKGWLKYITNRVLSFSLIVGLGFILLVSLVVSAGMDVLSNRLSAMFSNATFYILYGLNLIIIFLVISFFFAVIYKVLPDAKIAWKDSFKGAMFTAFLFMLGKFLIGLYLGNSKTSLAYGAAASLVIILLWVYYTSVILYFGAEFTKVYALKKGNGIKPYKNAVYIIKEEKKEVPPFTIKPENIEKTEDAPTKAT
jgi:membrane protein